MTETINFYPAPGGEAFRAIPESGKIHILGSIEPFTMAADFSPKEFDATFGPQRVRHRENPCLVVRALYTGGALNETVIQFCELEHHTDNLAHRMTNPDGSITTWRR